MWAGDAGNPKRIEFNVIQSQVIINLKQSLIPDWHMVCVVFFIVSSAYIETERERNNMVNMCFMFGPTV